MRCRGTGGAFALVLVAAAVAGVGCSASVSIGGKKEVQRSELEQGVKSVLASKTGQAPKAVECPHGLDAKVGASGRCTVTDDHGTKSGLTVKVLAVHGDRVNYDVDVDANPFFVSTLDVEQDVKSSLASKVGQTPKSIDCPHGLDAKVGASERCVLTAGDGTKFGLTAKVIRVRPGLTIGLRVDTHPLRAASG
jgi:hypothetical protein